jgi:hypothetical protein
MSGHNAQPVIPIVTTQEAPQCSVAQPISYVAQVSNLERKTKAPHVPLGKLIWLKLCCQVNKSSLYKDMTTWRTLRTISHFW